MDLFKETTNDTDFFGGVTGWMEVLKETTTGADSEEISGWTDPFGEAMVQVDAEGTPQQPPLIQSTQRDGIV